MPLKKLQLKPGVNRENTPYTSENGWYSCDKIRFRAGTPESIGGWRRLSEETFLGICRGLFTWITLARTRYTGVGTNLKFYVEESGRYYDITPLRDTVSLANPFTATDGSSVLTVADTSHGAIVGDFVTFSGASGLGGNVTAGVLNAEHQVASVVDANTYTINLSVTANATDAAGSPGGGGAVSAAYQINVGTAYQEPLFGWGTGAWGAGPWGTGTPSAESSLRTWSQSNFGEDLLFAPRDGAIYYWDSSAGTSARGVGLTTLPGASDTPTVTSFIMVSDVSRFVLAFGCNELGSSTQDPMLVRWSDQESLIQWTPSDVTQSGGIRFSLGSRIVTALQVRQEILTFTDSAVYSLQYLGPPVVWSSQLVGDNISIISPNSVAMASGVVFWMGVDKFYMYDGSVKTLRCDLRQFVFSRINQDQALQTFAGTNEGFNEVWWFYCSTDSETDVDSYVKYNYLEDVWDYGTMGRTAWLDSGLRPYPLAATYTLNLVEHETGVDDAETDMPEPINAFIESAQFDIDDGHNFSFIWRMLPDITFRSSTEGSSPQVTMTLKPMRNSGSGYNNPESVGGNSSATVARITTVPVEEFTGQVYIRVRGRQMVMRVESDKLGTAWQLGYPRIDLRPDGRR